VAARCFARSRRRRVRTEISAPHSWPLMPQANFRCCRGGQTPPPVRYSSISVVLLGAAAWPFTGSWVAPGYGRSRVARRSPQRGRRHAPEPFLIKPPPKQTACRDCALELSPEYQALLTASCGDTVAGGDPRYPRHVLLAQTEARVGQLRPPRWRLHRARSLRLKGTGPSVGGSVGCYAEPDGDGRRRLCSPEAEARAAVLCFRVRSRNGTARYYWGLMLVQTGRARSGVLHVDGFCCVAAPKTPLDRAPNSLRRSSYRHNAGGGAINPPSEIGRGGPAGPSAEIWTQRRNLTPAEA